MISICDIINVDIWNISKINLTLNQDLYKKLSMLVICMFANWWKVGVLENE